jgi:hypothetical protein
MTRPQVFAALLLAVAAQTTQAFGTSREAMCRMSDPSDVVAAWAESPEVRKGQIAANLRARASASERSADPSFDGFRLGVLDYRWRYVEPNRDPGDWPPIYWAVERYEGGFVMTFQRARWGEYLGEGEDDHAVVPEPGPAQRYVFVRRENCWVLETDDPRALPSQLDGEDVHWPTAEGAPVVGIDLPAYSRDLGDALFDRRSAAAEALGAGVERSPAYSRCVEAADGSDGLMTECEFEEQERLARRLRDRAEPSGRRRVEPWRAEAEVACALYPTYEGTLARLHAATCVTNRLAAKVRELDPNAVADSTWAGAPAVPRCVGDEQVLFACALQNGKAVALCASPAATARDGYVRYAYGRGEVAELALPSTRVPAGDLFRSTRVSYPSGNGRHAYSVENGGFHYVLYRTWEARDGHAAGGGLMVLDRSGKRLMHQRCRSMGDDVQSTLAMPPPWMPAEPLLDEGSRLDFTAGGN